MNGSVHPQRAMTAPTFAEATDLAVLDNEVLPSASIEPLAQGFLAWNDAQNASTPAVPGGAPEVTTLAVASLVEGLLLGHRRGDA